MNVKPLNNSTLKFADIKEAREKLNLTYDELVSYHSYDIDKLYKQMYIDHMSMLPIQIKTVKKRNVSKLQNKFHTTFDFGSIRHNPFTQLEDKIRQVAEAKVKRQDAINHKSVASSPIQGIIVMALGAAMMIGGTVMMLAM